MSNQPHGFTTAVAALRDAEADLQRQLARVRNALRELGVPTDGRTSTDSATGRGRRKGTVGRLEQIRGILREAGRMMTATEIRDALVKQDPSADWKTPGNVMRSITREQEKGPDEIVRPETGLYTLRRLVDALNRPEARESQPRGAIDIFGGQVRRQPHADILKEILREAGRPLRYTEIHAEMLKRLPSLVWNHPAESVRQLAARSHGAIVRAGTGKWALADHRTSEGGAQSSANRAA